MLVMMVMMMMMMMMMFMMMITMLLMVMVMIITMMSMLMVRVMVMMMIMVMVMKSPVSREVIRPPLFPTLPLRPVETPGCRNFWLAGCQCTAYGLYHTVYFVVCAVHSVPFKLYTVCCCCSLYAVHCKLLAEKYKFLVMFA